MEGQNDSTSSQNQANNSMINRENEPERNLFGQSQSKPESLLTKRSTLLQCPFNIIALVQFLDSETVDQNGEIKSVLFLDGSSNPKRVNKVDKAINTDKNSEARRFIECVVCQMSENEKFQTSRCGHILCKKCWEKWLRSSQKCPICGATVSSSHLIDLFF